MLLGGANPKARKLSAQAMQKGRLRGAEATKQRAREAYAEVAPIIASMRQDGQTLAQIAEDLTSGVIGRRMERNSRRCMSNGFWSARANSEAEPAGGSLLRRAFCLRVELANVRRE